MVYISTWEEFSKSVQNLYDMDPSKVNKFNSTTLKCKDFINPFLKFRFVSKYRIKSGLYLKATNDQMVNEFNKFI